MNNFAFQILFDEIDGPFSSLDNAARFIRAKKYETVLLDFKLTLADLITFHFRIQKNELNPSTTSNNSNDAISQNKSFIPYFCFYTFYTI